LLLLVAAAAATATKLGEATSLEQIVVCISLQQLLPTATSLLLLPLQQLLQLSIVIS